LHGGHGREVVGRTDPDRLVEHRLRLVERAPACKALAEQAADRRTEPVLAEPAEPFPRVAQRLLALVELPGPELKVGARIRLNEDAHLPAALARAVQIGVRETTGVVESPGHRRRPHPKQRGDRLAGFFHLIRLRLHLRPRNIAVQLRDAEKAKRMELE
jgi:hypothetical protein